ncbi:LOW QUALITY PROTEIN: methyl-CpG-binding domain protein 3-like [Anableps anableps]
MHYSRLCCHSTLRSDLKALQSYSRIRQLNTVNLEQVDSGLFPPSIIPESPANTAIQNGTMERKSLPVKRILNKPQIFRSDLRTDMNAGQPRAGRSLQTKVQRSRHKNLCDVNHQLKVKPDLNTTLPVRQTASIFKQPVTKITNHPNNKVKTDPQKAVDQPKQLFWERKLSGLNAFDIAEELVKTMDLPKGLQGVGPVCSDKTLLSAIASALHTSPAPITGQLTAAVEKNPGVWLNTAQPLCKAFVVTDDDIRRQEDLVQNVRRRLEEALMADSLAHIEDVAADAAVDKVEKTEPLEKEEL